MTQTSSEMMTLKPDGRGDGSRLTGGDGGVSAMEEHAAWPMISRLPVVLAVTIPLRGFKVRDLLNLRAGQTVATTWPVTKDVPLEVGELQLCWGEFEIAEQQLALRLTRLA